MNNITFIRAGAGSGKTYHVTGLIEEELRSRRLEPAGLVATTFTKKAATELRERLQARLCGAGMVAEAERMDEALLGTVHSIAARILERFAFEAGISPRLEVLAEDRSARLLAQAIDSVSDLDEVEALHALGDRLAQVDDQTGSHAWIEQVRAIIEAARSNDIRAEGLAACAEESCAEFFQFFPPPTADDLSRLMAEAIDRVEFRLAALPEPSKITQGYRDRMRRLRSQIAEQRIIWKDWSALIDPENRPGKKDGALDQIGDVLAVGGRLLEHPQLQAEIQSYTRKVFALAARSLGRFQALKAELGQVDFVDLEALTHDLLRHHETVRDQLKDTLGLLVVDEFQDTSPLQLALFVELAKCARQVVWVGDVKQAIYGFRGSDPALVDTTVAELSKSGGLGKTLDTNYRSVPALVTLANGLFAPAFKDSLGLKPEDVELQADRPPLKATSPAVEIFHLDQGGARGAFTNKQVAGVLAEGVASLLSRKPTPTVLDPLTKSERALRPGDIGVLTRTNDRGAELVAALSQRGIAASLAGPGLLQTPEALLALACLRCLADHRDRLAIAEVIALRGSADTKDWLANRLHYLAKLNDQDADEWGCAGETADPRVVALRSAHEQLDWLSVVEALDLALELGEVLPTVTGWGPDTARAAQRRANVEMLRGMARHHEETTAGDHAPATIAGFLAWCAEQAEAEADTKAWGSGDAAVQVLTYHKAKGLEWPVVICAELDAEPRSRWFSVRVAGRADQSMTLAAPLVGRRIVFWANPFGPKSARNPLLDRMAVHPAGQSELRRSQDEDLRLLYVGITRARDRLILAQKAVEPKTKKKDAEMRPRWLDVLKVSLPAPATTQWEVAGHPELAVASLVFAPPQNAPVAARDIAHWFPLSLPQTAKLPARITPSSELAMATARAVDTATFGQRLEVRGKVDDAVLGDALHAILAAELQHPAHADAERLAARVLGQYGLMEAIDAKAAAAMARRFREEVEQRFKPHSVLVECPFHYRRPNGQLVNGFLDLLLETDRGWVVVDHKSYRGPRADWTSHALGHSGQLAAYAQALAATGRQCAGTWIHFATGGGLVKVES